MVIHVQTYIVEKYRHLRFVHSSRRTANIMIESVVQACPKIELEIYNRLFLTRRLIPAPLALEEQLGEIVHV